MSARAETATRPEWPRRLLEGLDPSAPVSYSAHVQRLGELPRRRNRGADAELIELIDRSGLLGRGGAGFPTGRKMQFIPSTEQIPKKRKRATMAA